MSDHDDVTYTCEWCGYEHETYEDYEDCCDRGQMAAEHEELEAQLAAVTAERDALRAALDSVLFHTGAKCPICDACPQYLDDDAPAVTHAPDCEAAVESAQAAD